MTGADGFPFCAIVGQEEMKEALLLCTVDPRIGGVMIMGHRGTAKTTAVRGLAELVPELSVVEGCPFHCAPDATAGLCGSCTGDGVAVSTTCPVPVVDLPLGAT